MGPGLNPGIIPPWLKPILHWIDSNPGFTLFIPPALFLIQFLLLLVLVSLGFPDHGPEQKVAVSLLLVTIFGLNFICVFGMALGVRQAFVLETKVFPVVGVVANGVYMAGFILFFLFIIVLQNLT